MKKLIYSFILILFFSIQSIFSQTVVFSDDFEAGPDNWVVDGYWDVVDDYAYSGTYSFHDSPSGVYVAGEVQTATMDFGVDLSGALDADVSFQAIIDLEEGFDFTYLDVSTDGGINWLTVATFNGEDLFDWTSYSIPLGGFVGYTDVRLRFRFVPDFYVEYDGMYVDDFTITKYNVDYSPPLIVYSAAQLYEGTLEVNNINADIIDVSGIGSASLFYRVDASSYSEIEGINTFGDNYLFSVPEQEPGAVVDYYISATDAYGSPNTGQTDTFTYISGNYIAYEDAVIDFVNDIGDASASGYGLCAVKISLEGITDIVAGVIQNYTDNTRPNDSITIHIWDDAGGLPGDDLITPFTIFPEATLAEPNKGTKIDLRPYTAELSDISGDVYIGYGSSDGTAWLSQTTPGTAGRTYVNLDGFGWFSITDDYHFRLITSAIEGAPEANFLYDLTDEPLVSFTDLSDPAPYDWYWTFGDGGTSTLENPTHEYLSNGTFNVCLTSTNDIGSDTYCQSVIIDCYLAPDVDWSYSGDPEVTFTDLSANEPDTWYWIFDDGTTSTEQNPVHTYSANGSYLVCLYASNVTGESSNCKGISIGNILEAPEASFSFTTTDLLTEFTDLSTNLPDSWSWDFGDGEGSDVQNPLHLYDEAGEYEVCLTASNAAGEDSSCLMIQAIVNIQNADQNNLEVYPNPADEFVTISFSELNNEIIVLNTFGQILENTFSAEKEYLLKTKKFPAGCYVLKVKNEAGEFSKPFFIEH